MQHKLKKAAILMLWLVLWQLTAVIIHNPIYFAGPYETGKELLNQAKSPVFLQSVGGSFLRILSGFLIAAIAAYLLAFLAYFIPLLEDALSPVIQLLKSVPVAAVTVILLLWWGSSHLVLCISFMVVFPNVWQSMLTGLRQTDQKLLEMAKNFRFRSKDIFLWLYRPSYLPHVSTALSFSLGLAFKSGVAAEIIGLPKQSIGEQLYRDKIYLNTPGVFAWIIVILFISAVSEHLLTAFLRWIQNIPTPVPAFPVKTKVFTGKPKVSEALPNAKSAPNDLIICGIRKSYGNRKILNTDIRLKKGAIYHLSGPSGSGKTTLLHILAGLVSADAGNIPPQNLRMVFQEDRLILQANALRNLAIAGCLEDLPKELAALLPDDRLYLPVEKLSGGEKRRLSIARAVLSPADILLMDEPFNGLDPETKKRTAEWIKNRQNGRTLLIVSHDEEDVELLGAQSMRLENGACVSP